MSSGHFDFYEPFAGARGEQGPPGPAGDPGPGLPIILPATYTAASDWCRIGDGHTGSPTLSAGMTAVAANPPRFQRRGQTVYLRGQVDVAAGGGPSVFTVPDAFVPYVVGGDNALANFVASELVLATGVAAFCLLYISPFATLSVFATTRFMTARRVGLDGIAWVCKP